MNTLPDVGVRRLNVATRLGPIPVRLVGQGPPVLCVHGAFVDSRIFDATAKLLSEAATVVLPDLPQGAHRRAVPAASIYSSCCCSSACPRSTHANSPRPKATLPSARRAEPVGTRAGDRFAEVEITHIDQLQQWLESHHGQRDGIWLITYKKAAADRYVQHDAVLDLLVMFGWCDGGMRRIDDLRVMQQISPRRTQPWAKTYKDRAERLIAVGLMNPAGQAQIDRATSDGMWDAMNDVDALIVPDDLAAALACRGHATRHYADFPPSTRRNILRWIASARTPATRTRRITQIADDSEKNIRTRTNG